MRTEAGPWRKHEHGGFWTLSRIKTYAFVKGAAGTDEETSADGAANGNHVQMARLHGLVEDHEWATFGAALEGSEVETISGHEVFLVTPIADILLLLAGIVSWRGVGGRGSGGDSLLVCAGNGSFIFYFVLHGERERAG